MADQESLENPSPVGLDSTDEVSKVFTHFDSNGDGKISKSEIASVVRALDSDVSHDELQAMMDEMDSDGDGFIDLNEFAAFHRRRSGGSGSAAVDEEVRDAFEMYDLDKNGLISTDELHLVLKKLGEKSSARDCARMIRSVDADGDGSVNYEEFKKMMTSGSGGGGVAAVEEEGNTNK